MQRALPAIVVTLVLASPELALACAVCGGGTADNRTEFLGTTALLTFLPLLLIGGVIYGLRRRYLSLAHQEPSEDTPRIDTARAERAN